MQASQLLTGTRVRLLLAASPCTTTTTTTTRWPHAASCQCAQTRQHSSACLPRTCCSKQTATTAAEPAGPTCEQRLFHSCVHFQVVRCMFNIAAIQIAGNHAACHITCAPHNTVNPVQQHISAARAQTAHPSAQAVNNAAAHNPQFVVRLAKFDSGCCMCLCSTAQGVSALTMPEC